MVDFHEEPPATAGAPRRLNWLMALFERRAAWMSRMMAADAASVEASAPPP